MESTTVLPDSADRITENSIKESTSNPMNSSYQDTTQETVQYNALSQNELSSIVNVTREYPFDYATIMFGYMMPFVLVLTLITNTLVVMVLFQRHMRTPTNIVLFTMAIVDLSTLLSPSPWYFYIYTLGYYDKFLYPPLACYAHHIMTDVIPVFFHTSSIWLALLLASQRYIYVCHPTLARTWCTVPRVRKAIIIIIVVAFLHQLTRFFDNTFESIEVSVDDVRHPACKIEISNWVNKLNVAVYYTTYFTFRILFVFIIPCVALITLNCLLFRALRRAENKRTELLRTKFKSIANQRCSVVGLHDIKRPSYVDSNCNNRQQIVNEVSSTGLLMANHNKPSTSLANDRMVDNRTNRTNHKHQTKTTRQMDNFENAGDKSRKYSITLLQTKEQIKNTIDASNLIKLTSQAETTSDTRGNSLSMGDHVIKISNKPKSIRTRSDESNDSYSIASSRSRSDFVHNNDGLKSRHSHRFQDKRSVDDSADCDDEDYQGDAHFGRDYEEDDEFTCVECATCEDDLDCRRCSGGARDGATSKQNHCHRLAHRPISQCSSLADGPTNTITNDEDASSCAITQNASSSMYVIHDGIMETIETASIKEELANDTKDHRPLSKSDSVDSRSACGCLVSSSTQSSKLGRKSSPGRGRRGQCRECCILKNQCTSSTMRKDKLLERDGSFSVSRRMAKRRRAECIASCSNSDPCINCNSDTYLIQQAERDNPNGGVDRDDHNIKQAMPTSQSDYAGEANAEDTKNLYETSSKNTPACTNPTTTTTTTTTTLYSTKTNSVGSLIQGQNPIAVNQTAKWQGNQPGASHSARIKSPSIASTTGRGSRATLGGGGGGGSSVVPTSGIANSSATVSLRTMDSNRTTLMLIVVVTVFLLVEVPVAISHILHVVFNSFDAFKDIEFASSLNYIKLFTNFFIMISYSVNFTIYCSMSKKFRDTFRDLFLCGKRSKRKLYQQQQQQLQQSQYTQHHFNVQETQLIAHAPENINNTPTNIGSVHVQNDFTSGANRNNASAGVLRCPPAYKRAGGQQQECEL